MLRGISFISNSRDVFGSFRTLIDVFPFDWYIDDVEKWNCIYFRSGHYTAEEFANALPAISDLSFARIRRYPKESQVDHIDAYEDLLKSSCDLLMLYYDGGFCEIYAKDEPMILRLKEFFGRTDAEQIELVYDSDDLREYMHY